MNHSHVMGGRDVDPHHVGGLLGPHRDPGLEEARPPADTEAVGCGTRAKGGPGRGQRPEPPGRKLQAVETEWL